MMIENEFYDFPTDFYNQVFREHNYVLRSKSSEWNETFGTNEIGLRVRNFKFPWSRWFSSAELMFQALSLILHTFTMTPEGKVSNLSISRVSV